MPGKESICFSCPASLICETSREETTMIALFCPTCDSIFIRHMENADGYEDTEFVGDFTLTGCPEAQKAFDKLLESFTALSESVLPCVVRGRVSFYKQRGLADVRCATCIPCDTTPNTT